MARERNGETASAARDGRSWNAANDAAVELPCESVSTLVAMVTGGRARARSDCWRRDETVCFSARASRGSVAYLTSGFPRAPRSTPLQSPRGIENRHQTDSLGHPEPTSNETKLAKRRDIFAAPLGRGGSHCPPRFGRGSSPPTRRDGVEVGSETRDRGVRRGDARRRRRQRARAPGRSHREQVRRACVTKYTARRIEPARTDVARDRSRRTPTRATRAASRVSRPPTSRRSSADDRAVRSRAPRPEPIARRRSAKSFFVLSRTGRASRPFLAPARERGPRSHQSVGRRFLSCFFFGVPKKNVASFIVSHETDRLKTPTRRPIRAHHRLSPVRLSHLSYERTRRATNLKKTSPDARLSCGTAARKSRTRGRRAPSRRRAGSPRTRRTSPRTKSCRSPACRRR